MTILVALMYEKSRISKMQRFATAHSILSLIRQIVALCHLVFLAKLGMHKLRQEDPLTGLILRGCEDFG